MNKKHWEKRMVAVVVTVTMAALAFTGCTKEQTEEQSRALVALESVVSWYETTGDADHWEDLVALCFANYADGVAVDWSRISLPEAKINPSQQSSYTGAIITDIIKGEGNSSLYTGQLLLMQDEETGAFADGRDLNQHVYAMLALNISLGTESYDYEDAALHLLKYQGFDGGFSSEGESQESDIVLTGLASAALAPYFSNSGRSDEQSRLADFYVSSQDQSGGYKDRNGNLTVDAIAAAICGLTALELKLPEAEGSGKTPLDALLDYQNPDGSFRLNQNDDKAGNPVATRRAAIALCDIVNGMNTFLLLATDSETYRMENAAGPEILLTIFYPEESGQEDIHENFTIERHSSVFDAIMFYGLSEELPVSFSGGPNARIIEAIGSVARDDYGSGSGWIYYVNDQLSPFPPSAVILEEADHLVWAYATAEQAEALIKQLEQDQEIAQLKPIFEPEESTEE